MPRRPRRWLTAAVVASTLALLGSGAMVHVRAERSWQTMNVQVAALRATRSPLPRQALWGHETDGEAFPCYRAAADAIRPVVADDPDRLAKALQMDGEWIREHLAAERSRWQPALHALCAGAHARDIAARPALPHADHPGGDLLAMRWLASSAACEAVALLAEGAVEAAIEHTLDAAMLGGDLTRNGPLLQQVTGWAIVATAAEVWTDARVSALPDKARERLARGLERLDGSLPTCIDYDSELLSVFDQLQAAMDGAASDGGAWRYGFSTRWMLAEAFLSLRELSIMLANEATRPWPERRALLESECDALLRQGNPALSAAIPSLRHAELTTRRTAATVRLLRMAIDRHRGLDLPPLADPLGNGPIHVVGTDAGVRLRCGGFDGTAELTRLVVLPPAMRR